MFVVYSVAISTHNTVNLCLSKTYIWPTCNDSLSVYRAVPLEVIYILPTQTVHRWNSTWREIPDQFVIVGTCAGLVCCPKTYIEWSTRFLVLSGKLTVSCHRGDCIYSSPYILTICHANTWSETLIQQALFIVILWFAPASRCDNFS